MGIWVYFHHILSICWYSIFSLCISILWEIVSWGLCWKHAEVLCKSSLGGCWDWTVAIARYIFQIDERALFPPLLLLLCFIVNLFSYFCVCTLGGYLFTSSVHLFPPNGSPFKKIDPCGSCSICLSAMPLAESQQAFEKRLTSWSSLPRSILDNAATNIGVYGEATSEDAIIPETDTNEGLLALYVVVGFRTTSTDNFKASHQEGLPHPWEPKPINKSILSKLHVVRQNSFRRTLNSWTLSRLCPVRFLMLSLPSLQWVKRSFSSMAFSCYCPSFPPVSLLLPALLWARRSAPVIERLEELFVAAFPVTDVWQKPSLDLRAPISPMTLKINHTRQLGPRCHPHHAYKWYWIIV